MESMSNVDSAEVKPSFAKFLTDFLIFELSFVFLGLMTMIFFKVLYAFLPYTSDFFYGMVMLPAFALMLVTVLIAIVVLSALTLFLLILVLDMLLWISDGFLIFYQRLVNKLLGAS